MASSQSQAATAAWAKVTSQYHPERSCVSCFLCGRQQARYDHFKGLTADVQQYIGQYSTSSIPGDSCLCRKSETLVHNMKKFLHGKRAAKMRMLCYRHRGIAHTASVESKKKETVNRKKRYRQR